MNRNFTDLTRNIFGRLTVIKRMKNKKNKINYLCLCNCGTYIEVLAEYLRCGDTKSCGCLRLEHYINSKNIYTKSNQRWLTYLRDAKKKGLLVEITRDQFRYFQSQPCYYCDNVNINNGIDRLDSKLGYILENCVPCCWICNRSKNYDLNPEEFIEKARQIVRKWGIKTTTTKTLADTQIDGT